MIQNDIVAAFEIRDLSSAYQLWHRTDFGSFADFLTFITTPTPEREAFFRSLPSEFIRSGALVAECSTLNVS